MTPSSIDHDYNFLHSIEHRVERSEKEIVEERGLLTKDELRNSPEDELNSRHGKSRQQIPKQPPGRECINTKLKMMGTKVHEAPKGMKRNTENETTWSKRNRDIFWQVEWMREAGTKRCLRKILANKSIGFYYDEWQEEDRRLRMSKEEKSVDKKRKATEHKQRLAKRVKTEQMAKTDFLTTSRLQNPATGAWNIEAPPRLPTNITLPFSAEGYCRKYNHQLFLLRPLTSSKYPKILVPIDPTKSLGEILRKREVVEFPTIYVFEDAIDIVPDGFMTEEKFMKVTGQAGGEDSNLSDTSAEELSEDDTSSDGSDVEDGEIEG